MMAARADAAHYRVHRGVRGRRAPQGQPTISSRRSPGSAAIAHLEVESLKHVAPTFHGDTIYGETTVLGKRLTSRGDRGVVEVETRGYKQDGTLVCVFRRKVMVPTETYVKERGGLLASWVATLDQAEAANAVDGL